jgi:phosphohistidine swiveling domain-containing protein
MTRIETLPSIVELAKATDPARFGPKAAGLGRLVASGMLVPDGLCVDASEYLRHFEACGAASLLSRLTASAEVRPTLDLIREALLASPLRPALAEALTARIAELGAGPYAVRSSGTAEDLPTHSFAGQHGTYFAAEVPEVLGHVKHCWASLWSERAYSYRASAGLADGDVGMAVIVQRLVSAESAGVAFTADPASGRADRLVVESCFGLGEALVSGHVSPDRHVFARPGLELRDAHVAAKPSQVAVDETGAVVERPVAPCRVDLPAISGETARRIAEAALKVEAAYGGPVDLEWCVADGQVWLLQARPVTTRVTSPAPADARVTVWSNLNTGEVLPGVVTPMTWAIVQGVVDDLLTHMFGQLGVRFGDNEIAGLIAGRAYFNMSVFAAAFERIPGIGGSVDPDEMFGGHQGSADIPAEVLRQPVEGVSVGRFGVWPHVPAFVLWASRHGTAWSRRYCREAREAADAALAFAGSGAGEDALHAELLTQIQWLHQLAEGISASALSMVNLANLQTLSKKWLGDAATGTALLAGQGGVDSAEAGLAMWRLAGAARARPEVARLVQDERPWAELSPVLVETGEGRDFLAEWDGFMRDHGHHGRAELELANPRWRERPDYVLLQVRRYLSMPPSEDPTVAMRERAESARRLARDCRRRLGVLRGAVFSRVLASALAGSAMRENVKSAGVRQIAAIRALLLALADLMTERGALAERDDIFYLDLAQLDSVRSATCDAAPLVAAGRAEFARNESLSPPPVVVGAYDPAAVEVEIRRAGGADRLAGIAVSAGIAEGPARVFSSLDSDEEVLPGEILVAPFTDPGWTPYFLPAAGIVMDMGGMLSHGSIIAREYGIPAVVNVGDATTRIRTGQRIRVDGDTGEVVLLPN